MPASNTIDCTPEVLAEAAKCYCFDQQTYRQVVVYLLAQLADLGGLSPDELASRAACYCFPPGDFDKVTTYLLCQIANQ